jgi:hypothetical protein
MRLGSMLGVFVMASMGLLACSSSGTSSPNGSDTTASTGAGGASSSSSGAGGASSSSGAGGAATCADAAKAACDKLEMCAAYFIDASFGSVAHCAERIAATFCAQDSGPSTDPGACVAGIASTSCEALFAGGIDACDGKGSRADNAACAEDAQCKSGNCNVAPDAICGTCAPVVAEGGVCGMQDQTCVRGTLCVNGVCATLKKVGEACAGGTECQSSLACVMGKCAKGAGAGATCDPNAPACDSLAGLYCSPKTSTCTKIAMADVGGACGFDQNSGVFTICKDADCINQLCVPHLKDGDACDPMASDMPSCENPAKCVMGKCTVVMPDSCK